MKRICLILFLILFSNIEVSKANIFNNFTELNPCISGYNNFSDYKSKLQTCYEKKGIEFDKEIFKPEFFRFYEEVAELNAYAWLLASALAFERDMALTRRDTERVQRLAPA